MPPHSGITMPEINGAQQRAEIGLRMRRYESNPWWVHVLVFLTIVAGSLANSELGVGAGFVILGFVVLDAIVLVIVAGSHAYRHGTSFRVSLWAVTRGRRRQGVPDKHDPHSR
jgi:hypothetical protein